MLLTSLAMLWAQRIRILSSSSEALAHGLELRCLRWIFQNLHTMQSPTFSSPAYFRFSKKVLKIIQENRSLY
ncbi:MAG: hypothetical protein V4489_00655 [Chlamydiota bacterium]